LEYSYQLNGSRNVKSVQPLSKEKGIGASRECQLEQGFAKERITAMDELKSISMEMYESDFPLKYMKWTYYLSFKNGVTSLNHLTLIPSIAPIALTAVSLPEPGP